MMMMIQKSLQFGRRKLHTIISRELIKPSSPTPSHLRTYNLSQLDQCIPHVYMPLILFYPNYENCGLTSYEKAQEIKKSLSHSLARYYPFAGRLNNPTTPNYVDCNDEGVVFVEAKHDCHMDKGQLLSEEYAAASQLFADGMVWQNSPPQSTSLVGVQLNHFACGGMGVALSISHRVGDGCNLVSFASHWASVAHYGSTDHKQVLALDPHFIQSLSTIASQLPPETTALNPSIANRVIRQFVFPNSKLSDLKKKVLGMAEGRGSKLSINNPTRAEVLISLIYKTMVEANTSRSSHFMPSFLLIPMNLRNKFVPRPPQTTVGNLAMCMSAMTQHKSETSLSMVVSAIQKAKAEVEQVPSLQQASQNYISLLSRLRKENLETCLYRSYWYSSMCGFPYYNVDFGWGKPTFANVPVGSSGLSGCVLMDTPNGDGIVARVNLETQDMEIFQNDKELLSFCQN